MIKVEILMRVKHEGSQFFEGETRILDDRTAGYFCNNGWAKYQDSAAVNVDTAPKTLVIEPAKHGHQNLE